MTRIVAAPRSLSGLWGEALTVAELRRIGFDVEWEGGLTVGKDLIAIRSGKTWHVQVKTTQKPNGWIAWAKNGQPARDFDERARAAGASGAFYVLVQIWTQGTSEFDLDSLVLTITAPPDAKLVGLTAYKFADDVDTERIRYSKDERIRVGRNGESIGSLHREDGVIYPIGTGNYPYLHEFAATLP
jgi:hypothetical protein